MFSPCCLLPFFLRAELVLALPHVLALWCVRSLEGCFAKAVFLFYLHNMHFLGSAVLPWHARYYCRSCARYYRTQRGSNFLLPLGERYYRPRCGLPPRRHYRDDTRYYRAVESAWGLRAGRGSSNSPIPIHSFSPRRLSLSLLPKNGAGDPRRISISARSPRIPTGGIVPHHFLLPWNKVSPQIPLFLGCSFSSRFLGRCMLFLRF